MEERTRAFDEHRPASTDLGILRLAISRGKYAVPTIKRLYNSSALSGGKGGS